VTNSGSTFIAGNAGAKSLEKARATMAFRLRFAAAPP